MLRPMRTVSFLGPFVALISLYRFIAFRPELRGYQYKNKNKLNLLFLSKKKRPDNLDYVMKKAGNRL